MRIEQAYLNGDWSLKNLNGANTDLLMLFGATHLIKDENLYFKMRENFPKAQIIGCSTAGEILGTRVTDDTISITAIEFEKSKIEAFKVDINISSQSYDAGKTLGEKLNKLNLKHCFILSKGLKVNGSDLVKGLTDHLPSHVNLTGGLAGDSARFEETYVMLNEPARTTTIAAVGFYGNDLKVGVGSLGGCDPFGPERIVTKSKGNVCYEFNFQPSLDLYKK